MNKKGIVTQIIIILIVGFIISGVWFLSHNNLLTGISASAIKESCKKNCENLDKSCKESCEIQKKANEKADKACRESCKTLKKSDEQQKKSCKENCETLKKANEKADKACQETCKSDLETCKKDCKDKNETKPPIHVGCQAAGESCTFDSSLGTCRLCKIDTGCKLQCLSIGTECFEPCPI